MVHHVLAVHAGPFRRRAILETEAALDLVSKVPHIDSHREHDSEEAGLTVVPHETKGKLVLSRLDSNREGTHEKVAVDSTTLFDEALPGAAIVAKGLPDLLLGKESRLVPLHVPVGPLHVKRGQLLQWDPPMGHRVS